MKKLTSTILSVFILTTFLSNPIFSEATLVPKAKAQALQPDLIAYDLQGVPAETYAGYEPLNLSVKVKNRGTANAMNFKVTFYFDWVDDNPDRIPLISEDVNYIINPNGFTIVNTTT